MKYLVSKLQWTLNPVKPLVYYTDLQSGEVIKKELKVGEMFGIRVGRGKFCVGSETDKGWVSCMQTTGDEKPRVVFKGVQCNTCSGVDMFACRRTCTGNVCFPSSPVVKDYCQPPRTAVYLTEVGRVFKVGVSMSYLRRWIEQGSDYGYLVAMLPGLEARAVEQMVSKELGIKQQVGSKRKFESFKQRSPEEFKMMLEENLQSVKSIFEEVVARSGVDGEFFGDGPLVDLGKYYGKIDMVDRLQEFEVIEGAEFGGEIVGVKGAYLVVKSGMYYFAVSMKKIAGWEVEFVENAKNKGQASLDEWF